MVLHCRHATATNVRVERETSFGIAKTELNRIRLTMYGKRLAERSDSNNSKFQQRIRLLDDVEIIETR